MNAPAFGQSAEDVFGDRGYALAMDDRCGLFDTAQRAALLHDDPSAQDPADASKLGGGSDDWRWR